VTGLPRRKECLARFEELAWGRRLVETQISQMRKGRERTISRTLSRAAKRWLDVVGATALLLISFPLWLSIALAIRLGDGGPVFYRFQALGLGGHLFEALKFRTMIDGADRRLREDPELWQAFQQEYKLEADPRITRVGRWLRRLSLDELPQCLNVLNGEMSLVGPRPFAPYEAERYGASLGQRLSVRPGMTGLWQVSGRQELSYEERVRLDLEYIDRWSLWLDLRILFRTVPAVLSQRGAF
jgi:lipopolysaccharide/colanic/teichoic acid biosynthesis glycosyltransferase